MFKTRLPASLTVAKASGNILSKASFSKILSALGLSDVIRFAKIDLNSGGNYGYTFRVMPKHEMLLDSGNLDLVKWITK